MKFGDITTYITQILKQTELLHSDNCTPEHKQLSSYIQTIALTNTNN